MQEAKLAGLLEQAEVSQEAGNIYARTHTYTYAYTSTFI